MAKMNKVQLNVSVSEEAKRKADKYGASDPYSSTSNFVESAIMYYIGAIERERERKYEECMRELEHLRKEHERQTSTLLTLLNKHQELVDEANEIEHPLLKSKMLKVE